MALARKLEINQRLVGVEQVSMAKASEEGKQGANEVVAMPDHCMHCPLAKSPH